MKKVIGKRACKVIICLMFLAMFVLISKVSFVQVEAAAKPSISKGMTMGTGSISFYNPYYKEDKNTLSVSNPVKKATYSFTSSNSAVITVKSTGTKAYLTGVKAGNASITCNQKLNGKTTKIGTCNVIVEDVKVYDLFSDLPMGTSQMPAFDYSYRNCDATYTYVSDSKNLTAVDDIIKTEDGALYVTQIFTAKIAGTYTVTVKETYNKKTRTIGKLKFTVHNASIPNVESNMDIGDTLYAYYLIEYYRFDVPYVFEVEDESIIGISGTNESIQIEAKKAGTTTINIYEDSTKPDKNKLLGSCKITAKVVVLESIELDFYETEAYVGEDTITFEINKDPYNAPGTFTVTSSNQDVATVSEPDEDGYCEITPVGAGTTIITVTCGDITETQTITVYDDGEDDGEDEEE